MRPVLERRTGLLTTWGCLAKIIRRAVQPNAGWGACGDQLCLHSESLTLFGITGESDTDLTSMGTGLLQRLATGSSIPVQTAIF